MFAPNGNVSTYTLGGVATTYTYNDAGMLTSLAKGTELSENYTYARNGNKVFTVGTGTGVHLQMGTEYICKWGRAYFCKFFVDGLVLSYWVYFAFSI